VTGGNGAGKSTFLRLLHGQHRPATGGSIHWPALGDPRDVWTLRRQIGWAAPELQASSQYPTSGRGCLASGFRSSIGAVRAPTAAESERIAKLLATFDLAALADRPLTALSYGQARRALLARAFAQRPRLLLLDEPWEGLDDALSALFDRELEHAIEAGTQIVCASHLVTRNSYFTHELRHDTGRVVSAGPRPTRRR
jgi:molybdate transport system ATP-binding protein